MPRAIGDILPDAMPQLVERLAEVRVRQNWERTVGPAVAGRARPGILAEGCLTVVVDNSPWLHELTLRQQEILTMVRRECPSVKTLRLTVGSLPDESITRAVAASRPAAPLSEHDRREIEEATAIISDPALATTVRRLLARARQASHCSALTP
jgi:hypothetical protein